MRLDSLDLLTQGLSCPTIPTIKGGIVYTSLKDEISRVVALLRELDPQVAASLDEHRRGRYIPSLQMTACKFPHGVQVGLSQCVSMTRGESSR